MSLDRHEHQPTTPVVRNVMIGPVAAKKTEKKASSTIGSRQYPRIDAVWYMSMPRFDISVMTSHREVHPTTPSP
eukprot:CAMPEP_0173385252 /NCGR_PEP_ID=MMETSP1356-20130122/7861_1 /TAXON_ID=77927 ORGANISM="Hemiselmis virescens, Strain PCC157" /NCGR_SAMPLE_ID=MMETSP1356 /ASSEMBLY_ACC=CAM_ASM_000847 /LENGTH=73 /DNA_ID=CAMNT_0014340967 /DNA_START=317 /DNA_END=538 /DNA_ORIENTATION=+